MKNYDHADWEDDDVPNYDVDDDMAGPGRLRYAPGASILPSIVDAFAQCSYVLECYARQYNTYCTVQCKAMHKVMAMQNCSKTGPM